MITLSAFADEIAPALDEQIATLRAEGIRHLDLRSVEQINVLDLTGAQVEAIKRALDEADIRVAAIASPLGKVPIDGAFDDERRRFERAVALAEYFETPFIRLFSYYPAAEGGQVCRDEVIARLRSLAERAREAGVTLLHENEKGIYGDTIAHNVDLLRAVGGSNFAAVLDPANYIQCGQTPFPDAYEAVRPWLRSVHVKDALPDGTVVAVGEGAADWPALLTRLRADGYDGFLSLEPHLSAAGTRGGFSGPELFRHASRALRRLLDEMGWDHA